MSNLWNEQEGFQQLLNEASSSNNVSNSGTFTAATSQRVGDIYRQSPWMEPAAVLSLAKGGASSLAVDTMSNAASKVSYQNAAKGPEDPPWWKRALGFGLSKLGIIGKTLEAAHIDGPIKTGLRWADAGMRTPWALVNNVASDFADEDSDVDGWWASTPLGTMMSNSELAGEGYLTGEKLNELQAERARKYRGEINGHAFTIGRGAASLVFKPGSKPYNFLSGIIDGVGTVATDPTMVAGKAIKAARIGANIIPDTSGLVRSGVVTELLGKTLSNKGQIAFDESAFGKLMNGRVGRRVVETYAKETDPLKILEMTKGQLTIDDAILLAEATDPQEILGIIAQKAVRLSDELQQGVLFPESLRNIKTPGLISRMLPDEARIIAERLPLARDWRMKWLSEKADEVISFDGTAEDKTKTFMNIGNYLKRLGYNPYTAGDDLDSQAIMKQALDVLGEADSRTAAYKLNKMLFQVKGHDGASWSGIFARKLESIGIPTEQITEALITGKHSLTDGIKKMRNYSIDEFGDAFDGGTVSLLHEMDLIPQRVWDSFDVLPADLRITSPGSMVEMQSKSIILPNPKVFDALETMAKSQFKKPYLDAAKRGEVLTAEQLAKNPVTDVLDLIQGSFWKPAALATGGYILRNSLDAQLRMMMSGLSGMFNHPFDFIRTVSGKTRMSTFNRNEPFVFHTDDVDDFATYYDDLASFNRLKNTGAQHQIDQAGTVRRLVKSGEYVIADRVSDAPNHTIGIIDSIRRIFKDPFMSLYTKTMHLDKAERVLRFEKYLDRSPTYELELRTYFKDGLKVAGPDGVVRPFYFKDVDSMTNADIARVWENLSSSKVETLIGKGGETNPLRTVAQFNALPKGSNFVVAKGDSLWDEALDAYEKEGEIFTTVTYQTDAAGKTIPVEQIWGVERVDRLPLGASAVRGNRARSALMDFDSTEFRLIELGEQGVLEPDLGSAGLRSLIDDLAKRQLFNADGTFDQLEFLPQKVLVAQRNLSAEKTNMFDRAVRKFFSDIYGNRVVLKLEKSPVYRQYYYAALGENTALMSPAEARKLLDNIAEFADIAAAERTGRRATPTKLWDDLSPRERQVLFVGDESILKNLETAANVATKTRATPTGTIQQMQDYASAYALRRTEDLLFNATKKNNLQEAFRIISPFNAAWAEVLGSYAKFMIEDPTRLLKAQRTFNAGVNFNLEEEGDGFLFKDPVSGDYNFNFPLTGPLYGFLTGGVQGALSDSKISLALPLKGFSVGLAVSPGVGPMVQIATAALLPNTPDTDYARKFLLPYGGTAKDAINPAKSPLVPGWIKKVISAFEAGGEGLDMSTLQGQTYGDVLRFLAASGKYNPSDPQSREDLFNDAKGQAKLLTFLRAINQLVGPATGAPSYLIGSTKTDQYSGFLVKEFNRLKEKNYDTAVGEFLKLYGESAMVYISSKTRAEQGGLELSKEFGDFERNNKGLFSAHPDVAGFLGPSVEGFDQATFNRQTASGQRTRSTGKEMIESAELRVASSLYRAARLKAGQYPTQNQLTWLANYRVRLHDQYPGFPIKASFDPGEFPNTIQRLRELVADSRTQSNANADSIRRYLNYRDQALAKMQAAGYSSLNSRAAQPLRDWLASMAADISEQNPGFQRVYDRELASEIET